MQSLLRGMLQRKRNKELGDKPRLQEFEPLPRFTMKEYSSRDKIKKEKFVMENISVVNDQ